MKKRMYKMVALLLSVAMAFGLTACGGGDGEETNRKRGKKKVSFWAPVGENNQETMLAIVEEFNKTHEDITVTLVPQSTGYSSNLANVLRGGSPPDVVVIEDKYFKNYVKEGYLEKLDDYIAADEKFSLDDMWESAVNRYSYNPESGYSGTGSDQYAIPSGNNPSILYYNKDLFEEQKVNIISVGEEELEDYNSKNGASYLPHGYYVYDTAPAQGLTARADGKYYVFNNQIPTNWEELVELSKLFTKSYNNSSSSTYGFLNEWWFSHGWSVGGDCLEWDEEQQQYIFNLGDETPNYLVTGAEGATVNGTQYAGGDLLSYEDKKYVKAHASDSDIAGYISSETLYRLPSIRDAFTEFVRLSQTKERTVTDGVYGYAVSPSPTTLGNNSKSSYFTTGEVAIVCETYDACYTIGRAMETLGKEWDVAPMYQYREYNSDGTPKTVNGTTIYGKVAGHSVLEGYAIPAQSKNKEAAWEFIKYLAGQEGQTAMIKTNNFVPNSVSLSNSEAYLNATDNCAPGNKKAVVYMSEAATVGDWSYVEDGEWINGWANILNTQVRDGNMTLDQFFENATVKATDELLKKYTSKKYNK